jgi:hypothetical protein
VLATMVALVPSVADMMQSSLTGSCLVFEDARDLWRGDERRQWQCGEDIKSLNGRDCGCDGTN